jgi:hypothetical protein
MSIADHLEFDVVGNCAHWRIKLKGMIDVGHSPTKEEQTELHKAAQVLAKKQMQAVLDA